MKHFYQSFETSRVWALRNKVNVWDHRVARDITIPRTVRMVRLCLYKIFIFVDAPWSEWTPITDPDPDHPKGTHPICLLYTAYLLMPKWKAVRSYGLVWTTTAQNCHKSFQNIKHCTIVLTIVQERSFGIFTSVSVFSSTSHYPFTSATVGISVHICNEEL